MGQELQSQQGHSPSDTGLCPKTFLLVTAAKSCGGCWSPWSTQDAPPQKTVQFRMSMALRLGPLG